MILVTVGTHEQGFDRLVKAADELANQLKEEVIIQTGSSTYLPKRAKHFPFGSAQQMLELTRRARVVISHAAAGSIIMTLRENKPLVVVPRLKIYGEHFDDHQLQLAVALDASGRAIYVIEPAPESLSDAIARAGKMNHDFGKPLQLVMALRDRLAQWQDGG